MTTEIAVSSVAEKRSLHQRTGASTVDMESASVGAKAAEANIPFIVIRAAADPAERALPQSALVGLAPNPVIHAQQLSLASSLGGPGNSLNFFASVRIAPRLWRPYAASLCLDSDGLALFDGSIVNSSTIFSNMYSSRALRSQAQSPAPYHLLSSRRG